MPRVGLNADLFLHQEYLMSNGCRWSLVVAAALVMAAPASAQEGTTGELGVTPTTLFMQSMAPLSVLPPVLAAESSLGTEAVVLLPPVMRRSQSVAMMIVGGAGMIVGSLIDGDTGTIIMAGGGVVGLVGLYHYLR